jgi:hypothetical protein
MFRSGIALIALAGMLCCASVGQAQVDIKVPFVRVSTGGPGGGVLVKAPFVTVNVPPQYPAYYQPAPVLPQPQPLPQPNPSYVFPPQQPPVVQPPTGPTYVIPPQPGPVFYPKAMTHYEFAKVFVPVPGTHKVTLIHPCKGNCVDVCFNLPPGCPKVCVGHKYIEFDYGHCEVEIRFCLFGKVRVDYD